MPTKMAEKNAGSTTCGNEQEEHEPSSFPAILFEWFEGFRAWHVSELSWIVGKT